MGNPLIPAQEKQTVSRSVNPLIPASGPAPGPKPAPAQTLKAAETPSLLKLAEQAFAETFADPAPVGEPIPFLDAKRGDELITQGLKFLGRTANTAATGAVLAPVDEFTRSAGEQLAENENKPFLERALRNSAIPFVAGGQAAKKLFIDPQVQLSEEADQLDQQAMIAKAQGDREGARNLAVAASNKRALSIIPFAGPSISHAAGKIGKAVDEGNPQGVFGAILDLGAESVMTAAGLQSPKAAQSKARIAKTRNNAIRAFLDADMDKATAEGRTWDRTEAAKRAEGASTQDLLDTVRDYNEKKTARARMAQPKPEVPPTDVIPETVKPEIKAKVPESNPAMPVSDLAKLEQKPSILPVEQKNVAPKEGSPAPALLEPAELARLEEAGFTLDSQGRLAKIVRSADRTIEDGFPVSQPEAPATTKTGSEAPRVRTDSVQNVQTPKVEAGVSKVGEVAEPTYADSAKNDGANLRTQEAPTFTQGDQPGANYTSEQLKAFKEKNGIKDEPLQIVGEKPKAPDVSARKGERGAVRPDLFTGAPLDAAKQVGEKLAGGKGVIAASGSRDIPRDAGTPPPSAPKPGAVPPGDLPKYAGSVNMERLNTAAEVKQSILSDYESRKGAIDPKRKNVVSQEETLAAAREIGLDQSKVQRLVKQNPNYAAEVTAVREHNLGVWEQVKKIQEKAASERASKGEISPATLIEYNEAISRASAAHEAIQGRSAEIGRALNAHRIYAEAARLAKTNAEQAVQLLQKQLGENWKQNSEFILDRISKLDPNDTVGFNKLLRDYTKFSAGDKLYSYWVANLLAGLGTQVKNLSGNTTMIPLESAARALAGGIDAARSAITGGPRQVYAGEAIKSYRGRMGAKARTAAFENAMTVLRDGIRPDTAQKLSMPQFYEFPGGWKNPWNLPGRLLSAGDAIFKTTALGGELHAQAWRQAKREGHKGKALDKRFDELLAEPTPEMVEAAIRQSKLETFTDEPGKVLGAFHRMRELSFADIKPEYFQNEGGFLGRMKEKAGGVKPLAFPTPFLNVTNNLLKRMLDYSPAGYGKLLFKAGRTGPGGPLAAARATIGSAFMLYAMDKYMQGELTGAAPKDAAERALWLETRQPFSILIGDHWVRYTDYFGPLALVFMLPAAVGDAQRQYRDFPAEKVIAESLANVAGGITEASFMKGVKDIADTLSGKVQGAGEKLASGVAGGFVPLAGALRTARNLMDAKQRDPEGIYERLLNGIPYLSETVPARLSPLGEEIDNSRLNILGLGGKSLGDIKNPEIIAELERLQIPPAPPRETITVLSRRFDLSRDQHRELTQVLGDARKQALRQLFNDQYEVTIGTGENRVTDVYSRLNDEQKRKAIEKALDDAYEFARDEFVNRVNQRKEPVKESPKRQRLFVPIGALQKGNR